MARHKEFDRATVLDQAMRAFWRRGYEATSIQDLVEATGINRASMYDSFGDKHGLFQAAVQHYIANVSGPRLKRLEAEGSAVAAIRGYFEELAAFSAGEGRDLGCLITNSAVELAPHDPVVAETLRQSLAKVEDAFYRALLRARAGGEVPEDMDLRATARFLTATVNGVRVLARANPDPGTLRDVVATALAILERH